MVSLSILAACLLSYAALTTALPKPRAVSPRAISGYAPIPATCPSTQLVRTASGISEAESNYTTQRYQKASKALGAWLKNVNKTFELPSGGQGKLPVLALTSSGGGYRAMLAGAGTIKGFDGREPNVTAVGGLYQALTYHAGLSGGSWLLSSIIGNNYPTISSLQKGLWETTLQSSLLVPQIMLSPQAAPVYSAIEFDVQAKLAAGFKTSIIDPWGRLLSYALLNGTDGGVNDTMSGVASSSNFSSHNAPYPIITALGSNRLIDGTCIPLANATQYEFHPFEFGSWDKGVDAFVASEYLGTSFSNGKPNGSCITHYDQLGYVLGTSSNVFGSVCGPLPAANSTGNSSLSLVENLAEVVAPGQPGVPESGIFGLFPNPFQNYPNSSLVSAQPTLELVDGGVGIGYQGNPIWPFLHRNDVDVIIVNDNSADNIYNFPNGSEILHTYQAAVAANLTRMPVIPDVATFVSKKLNQKPTFFGCNTNKTATIIYIPNFNYTYQSGQLTTKIQYYKNETDGMIANGARTAAYGGKANWPLCLGCGIMKKSGTKLPSGCAACFTEYCFN